MDEMRLTLIRNVVYFHVLNKYLLLRFKYAIITFTMDTVALPKVKG